uniref:Core Histone H2A/H2B/H3 domain-containing protein n=1 Tax=Prolemur simus TaxID=1328070 RepID=A0A8C8YKU0_PROSS
MAEPTSELSTEAFPGAKRPEEAESTTTMTEPTSEMSSEAFCRAKRPEEAESTTTVTEPTSETSSEAFPGAEGPGEAESTTAEQQKQRRRRRGRSSQGGDSFATYFHRVLKQVHNCLSLSQASVNVMDSLVHDIFERLAVEAGQLARYTKRSTITTREIQTAVRLVLPGNIGRHAVSWANKAVLRYTRSK